MSINVFTFSGRLGRDAETRYTQGGKPVTSFTVAVDVGFGERKQTMWVSCACWGDRWEKLAPYLTKGGMVTVTGEAELQTYKGKDGEKTNLGCNVRDIQLPPKQEQDSPTPRRQPPRQSHDDSDEIPY